MDLPTNRPWEPRPYQALALDFLARTPRANLYADMGLGKTSTCLELVRRLDLDDVLVLAPKRVAHEVWPVERTKWAPFGNLDIAAIQGLPGERHALLTLARPRIATINYDQLLWLVEWFGSRWPFKTIIADESTRLKGLRMVKGTKRSKALSEVAFDKVERWINLTGLPNPNGLPDLWGPQWFIDGGAALGRSYEAFTGRWCYFEATGGRGPYKKLKMFPHAQAEIEARMRPSTLSVRAKDWFDLEEPLENTVYVSLEGKARAHYKTMERNFYATLAEGLVTAANCAVKSGKLIQMASGAVYHAEDQWAPIHDEKIEGLRSIVAETNGANLFVVYQFIHERERILAEFPKAVDIKTPGAIVRWNKGEIRMLLCHPKSAGHGLNLQDGGHHIVYFSPTWDLELHAQVLERIGPVRQLQSGYDRPVYVHHLIARGTIDEVVKKRREDKADVVDALLEAMKEIA